MASWLDKMLGRVRDADSLDEARKVLDDYIDPTTGMRKDDDNDGDQHIHLHLGGKGESNDADPDPDDMGGEPGDTNVAQLAARVEKLEQIVANLQGEEEDVELEDPDTQDARRFKLRRGSKMKRTGDQGDVPVPERREEIVGETDLPGIQDLDKRVPTGDRLKTYLKKTRDSADQEDLWKETVAAAEIIQPGVRVPTFDARLQPDRTAERLCSFRRRVMDSAFSDQDTATLVKSTLGISQTDLKVLPCDSVKMAFLSTAAAIRSHNNGAQMRRTADRSNGSGGNNDSPKPITIAEIQARNKKAWATGEFKEPTT
jgi:hypothetical protein